MIMDLFGYGEISLFCVSVLSIMLFALRTSLSRLTNQTILTHVFLMVMLLFVFDFFSVAISGQGSLGAIAINHILSVASYSIFVLLLFQWLRFVGYNMQLDFWHNKRKIILLSIPAVLALLLVFLSFAFGFVYRIDADNFRLRGNVYFVYVICCLFYLVATTVVAGYRIFNKRYYSDRFLYLALASFGLVPAVFLLVGYFTGTRMFCAYAMVASLLFVFLELQSRMISTDPLTKLNNRNQLNVFLDSKLNQNNTRVRPYLFVLDLDKFKDINDNYGHHEGDRALNMVADVLKRVCGPMGCFISRFGGDEFNLVAELAGDDDAEKIKSAVVEKLAFVSAALPYRLTVSVGYAPSRGKGETLIDLFERADEALYKEKANR